MTERAKLLGAVRPYTLRGVPEILQPTDRRIALSLAVLTCVFFAIGIDQGSHYDSDDSLYAEMARQMWSTGDWIDNRWSGTVLFEKPPLLLWSMALTGGVFDWTEWSLRIPLVAFASLAIWSLFGIYRATAIPRLGALTGCLMLLVSFYFIMMTRRLMMDLPMVACTLYALFYALGHRWRRAGIGAGLAVLAKGIAAGPLVLAVVGTVFIRAGGARREVLRGVLVATAWALLVVLPWHIAVTLRHGGAFWSAYIGHHAGTRATEAVVPGIALSELFALLIKDGVLLALAAMAIGRGIWQRIRKERTEAVLVVGLLWSALAILPVLVSTTRLPHYAFPFVVGLTLCVPAAFPRVVWSYRFAPWIVGTAVALSTLTAPGRIALWLNADLAPAQKALGSMLRESVRQDDCVAAFNTTTAALTYYAGGRRVEILASDPRFLEVQRAVLMNQMVGQVHEVGAGRAAFTAGARRFIVARQGDLDAVIQHVFNDGLPLVDDRDSTTGGRHPVDSRTEDSRTEDSRTEDSRTEDSRTEDSRTEDSRTEDALAPAAIQSSGGHTSDGRRARVWVVEAGHLVLVNDAGLGRAVLLPSQQRQEGTQGSTDDG